MTISHRAGTYEVRFTEIAAALRDLPASSYIVTDSNVFAVLKDRLPTEVPILAIEPGEASKSPQTYLEIVEWLASQRAPRNATIVALGGGVVGDLAGFAAATYMRGVRLLQIPTTLLAQVDSSVGGKVGVDLAEGKNLLGAFYPPAEVRVCVGVLESLPARHFANGMAEVVKYGFIMQPELLSRAARIKSASSPGLAPLVEACIDCKRRVVEADEYETTGLRAILNFGHTVGHAIEAALGYKELLHGEAIGIGMVVEALLSERLQLAPPGVADEVERVLSTHGLPTTSPILAQGERLVALMRGDKKAQGGLAMSLLRKIGQCELVVDLNESDVLAALKLALKRP